MGQIHPEEVAFLPKEWSISVGNGLWRHAKHIIDYRPKVGMFHFNGQGARKMSWFSNKNGFPYKHSTTFENALLYYVHMPWTRARFQGESLAAGGEKYKLIIESHDKSKSSSNSTKTRASTDEKSDANNANVTSFKVDATAVS